MPHRRDDVYSLYISVHTLLQEHGEVEEGEGTVMSGCLGVDFAQNATNKEYTTHEV